MVLLIELTPLAQPHKLLVLVCTYMWIKPELFFDTIYFLLPPGIALFALGSHRRGGVSAVRILQFTPVYVHKPSAAAENLSRFQI